MRGRDENAARFNKNQGSVVEKSPTSMKLKNTFILQNNNPSFDNYAAMMKKRKSTSNEPSKLTSGNPSLKAK